MVNINKLKAKIVENGFNVEYVADKVGMDKATFYRKMANNGETFLVKEVDAMARVLKMTGDDINAIFFAQTVA